MKKIFLFIFLILITTGCKKDFECSKKLSQDGVSVNTTIYANFKKGRLKEFKLVYNFETENDANKVCESNETAKCEKNKVIFTGDNAISIINDPAAFKNISKNEFKNLMKDMGFSCKQK